LMGFVMSLCCPKSVDRFVNFYFFSYTFAAHSAAV
jgi:hypothetical protein